VTGYQIGGDESCRSDDRRIGEPRFDPDGELLEHQRCKLGGLFIGRGTRRAGEYPKRR
jgi:hypothetical protein